MTRDARVPAQSALDDLQQLGPWGDALSGEIAAIGDRSTERRTPNHTPPSSGGGPARPVLRTVRPAASIRDVNPRSHP